jgi:hypothetical protein
MFLLFWKTEALTKKKQKTQKKKKYRERKVACGGRGRGVVHRSRRGRGANKIAANTKKVRLSTTLKSTRGIVQTSTIGVRKRKKKKKKKKRR